VVNCAGLGAITPVSADKWQAVQAVTLRRVLYEVKHGALQMIEGKFRRHHQYLVGQRKQAGEAQVAY
jgi:glucose 1-dehydrogenase